MWLVVSGRWLELKFAAGREFFWRRLRKSPSFVFGGDIFWIRNWGLEIGIGD